MEMHQLYMQRCLDLAALGAGTVSPNPMVGAVIVHGNTIIGEGYTSPYGGSHAEVNAVRDATEKYGDDAKAMFPKSTIYVSLEPCAHYGKTPPCADMLIHNGFKKVVIACLDPFAKVNGAGIKKLTDAGLDVQVGVLEEEAKWLNRRFFNRVGQYRPYVILKWAETADGYFAPDDGTQRWISNTASKQLVHRWRAEEDAVLVGTKTALVDNPELTVRLWDGTHPKRILIDKNLAVPEEAVIFNNRAETIVFNESKMDWQGHIKHIALENFDLYLPQNLLYQLYLMDVQSILIEGGVHTLQQFVDAGLWDEARVFSTMEEWGTGLRSPKIKGKELRDNIQVAGDCLKIYVPTFR